MIWIKHSDFEIDYWSYINPPMPVETIMQNEAYFQSL